MLQMVVVGMSGRSLRLPTRIRSVCVDPLMHAGKVCQYAEDKKGLFGYVFYSQWFDQWFVHHVSLISSAIDVHVYRCLDSIVAGGVQICGLHATVAPRRQQQQSPPVLEEFVFIPNVEAKCLSANGKLAEKFALCKGTSKTYCLFIYFVAVSALTFQKCYIHCMSSSQIHCVFFCSGLINKLKQKLAHHGVALSIPGLEGESESSPHISELAEPGLLRLLALLCDLEVNGNLQTKLQQVVEKERECLLQDNLLQGLLESAALRHCLDTTIENVLHGKIKVIEVRR